MTAIAALWIDGVQLLIGKDSRLLAAVHLLCISTWGVDKVQMAGTIQKVVEQWFRLLGRESADSYPPTWLTQRIWLL